MKLKSILSATLLAGVISARAVTGGDTTNSAANPDTMTALFGDPVIVKGKGFEIKRSELDTVVTGAKANAAAANQSLPAGFEISVLNQLVTIQLLLQKATPADKAAGQAEADKQYTNLLANFSSPEAFARQLKMVGMTEADLRAKATQEAAAKSALRRELNLNVTDAQIKSYFSNHAATFEEPEKAHVRHILLLTIDPKENTPLPTNEVAAKRKQIEDIQKRAAGGEDFAALAKQYSEDATTKVAGGELTPFGRSQMVPEFEAAAFALKPGQVSDVVTTMYGFHVIKLIDRTPAKTYGLTDYVPQIDMTVAAYIKGQLEGDQIREQAPAYVAKLRKDSDVQILDPSLKALEQIVLEAATNSATAPGGSNP
ncbi:MAG TPA: peptidylprolyl isomerase [Candidatus Acidoferrales bacterium]|jgi:parvulin-like peptidyl-prolyl isomerase|nr:peptidylprolyl isomerase [Candidatus Acidoferrales bacterium]